MSAQTTLMGNASIDNNTPSHRQEQLQACDVQNMTEKQNGIRCSWNIFPASPRDAQKLVAPLGCIYTPKKPLLSPNNILLPYSPLSCSKCGAKLNPYCPLDVSESPSSKKTWMCVFCQHCNFFPPHYSTISSTQMPGEVFPCNTTVEYQPPQSSKTNLSPALIFVVDTCALRCELAAICSAISNVLEALPDDLLVGCITFGRTVSVHNVQPHEQQGGMKQQYCFKGNAVKPIPSLLHFSSEAGIPGRASASKFLLPLGQSRSTLQQIFADLEPDPWNTRPNERPLRCSGAALSAAVALLEASCGKETGGKIVAFLNGPCTLGPGKTVDCPFTSQMRTFSDLEKNKAPYLSSSCNFYSTLAAQLEASGHAFDLFCAGFEECGAMEMQCMVDKTGGLLCVVEEYTLESFQTSVENAFSVRDAALSAAVDAPADYSMAFAAKIRVQTSPTLKVCGAIGPCVSLGISSPSVSSVRIGECNTDTWQMGSLVNETSLAFFFCPSEKEKIKEEPKEEHCFLQFTTSFLTMHGQQRIRVCTVCYPRAAIADVGIKAFVESFDQYATLSLYVRLAMEKLKSEERLDVLRWVDRNLIRLMSVVGDYQQDAPGSFVLSPRLVLFPQFIFHLRRSCLFRIFNTSPDAVALVKSVLRRETATNTAVIIQPTLKRFSFAGPPTPVPLDATSLQPDVILLLDSYFIVLVYHGEQIAAWVKEGIHKNPAYAHFARLLHDPETQAQELIQRGRFPCPRLLVCQQNSSNARHLTYKLNPPNTRELKETCGETILTDDVSLQAFLERLVALAVKQS